MKRRDLVALAAAAVALRPLPGTAEQQPMPLVGFLSSRSPRESADLVAAFKKGLEESGYPEGKSVVVEYRWADGRYERLAGLAAELVGRRVAVIVAAGGPPSALAAKAATTTIPIVFTSVGDPVESGLVASLARPGANITGNDSTLTVELDAKRLELLHELLPVASTIGVLINPNKNVSVKEMQIAALRAAAEALKLELAVSMVAHESEFDRAFAGLVERRVGAVVVTADPFFDSQRDQVVALAAHHRLPAIYQWRQFAAVGGLMSYGASLPDAYRHAGLYAGRILKGEKPADLPVEQPTKFELVINLRTAKALGLSVPQSLLARADEVIE